MTACTSTQQESSAKPRDGKFFGFFLFAIIIIMVWFAIAAITILVESNFGVKSYFLGFSRIWVDTIFLPIYVITVLMYLATMADKIRELPNGDTRTNLFWPLVKAHPWLSLFCSLSAIAGIAGIPFTFAVAVSLIAVSGMVIALFALGEWFVNFVWHGLCGK